MLVSRIVEDLQCVLKLNQQHPDNLIAEEALKKLKIYHLKIIKNLYNNDSKNKCPIRKINFAEISKFDLELANKQQRRDLKKRVVKSVRLFNKFQSAN